MKQVVSKFPVYVIEFSAVYGVLAYLKTNHWIPDDLFYLLLAFFCLVFSLYYGVKGACASAVLGILLLLFSLKVDMYDFLSQHYMETSFLLGASMVTGFIRTGMEKKMLGIQLVNDVMRQRVERLTVELSEKDKALQDTFRDILVDMESPRIMYQTIRRLEYIEDRKTLFTEILYMLYTHCHAEKSCMYQPVKGNQFKKIASFGASTLPDMLKWKEDKMPEIIRVAKKEREVIIPTRLNNRYTMAVPLVSSSGNILYIILIEEIRFINMNDALLDLLKAAAFWMKNIVENHFHREEFLPISAFKSVIVYRKEIGKKELKDSISSHHKYKLPFACLRIKGIFTEEDCMRMSGMVRIHDEFFMIADDELVVVLTMILNKYVPFVVRRLRESFPKLSVEVAENVKSLYG